MTATGGRRGSTLRRTAVLMQVAVSTVLLVVSALLAVSLRHMQQYDVGFRTDHLAMATVDLKFRRVPRGQFGPYASDLIARTRALPGVTTAALAVDVPLGGGQDSFGYRIPGYTPPNGKTAVPIDTNIVSAGYFDTLGLTFVKGHAWAADSPARVVVINETAAARFWPGRDAIDQPVEFIGQGVLTVAGIVRDSVNYDIGESPLPYAYVPFELAPQSEYVVVARTSIEPRDVLPAITGVIQAVDSRARVLSPTTFEDAREVPLYPRRMMALISTLFGAFAVILTTIGLYGVVSQSVGQRTREIGVRVALGARSGAIQFGVIRQAMWLAGVGAIGGLAGGYALAGGLQPFLFGVKPFDALIYAVVALALSGVAILAAWLPARRASRVDPVVALRQS